MQLIFLLYLLVAFIFTGCNRYPPFSNREVSEIVEDRIGKFSCQFEPIQGAVSFLLSKEITASSAVQIALLNNPKVQSIFDELGIAYADLIEAGLFRNPIFDGYVRFPDHLFHAINYQFSIAQSFLDIFLVPLKKKVAEAEFEKIKSEVASSILNLSFEVEEAFYSYSVMQSKVNLLEYAMDAADVASHLSTLQQRQGNINELERQARLQENIQAKIAYTQSKIELIRLREDLNRLMGLPCSIAWTAASTSEEMQEPIPEVYLESIAILKRFDLEATRWEILRLSRLLNTKKWWTFLDGTLGVSAEQEAENFREIGPSFSIPLPFFNYGQADRIRIKALYSQSFHRLQELEIATRADVRSANRELHLYRELLEDYKGKLIPLQQKILNTSLQYYNFMSLGIYQLIGAKRQEIEMEINFQSLLLSYWMAKIKLNKALGGNLEWAMREIGRCQNG